MNRPRFFKKINIWVSIPIFLIVIYHDCSKSEQITELSFWAFGSEGEYISKLIPAFENRNPGIKIIVQSIPWTAAHEKLLTAYAGNAPPNICQLGNTWISEFVALDAIEPLDSLIELSETIDLCNYFPGIWETNRIDNQIYGVPWYVDTRVLFYRKDLLTKIKYPDGPKTWDELIDACRKLVQLDLATYGIFLPLNDWRDPILFGIQSGSNLLRDNNCYSDFSSKKFREAFEFLLQFFREELCPLGVTEVTNIYQGFGEGYFAMLITGPWNIGEFSRRLPENIQDKWMTAPLPAPENSHPGYSLAGGCSLVIFKNSNYKEASWKLIEYLSEQKTQIEFYKLTGDLPAHVEVWQDSIFVNNPYVKAFYQQFQYVKSTPKIPEWEQIALKVQQYMESAAYGEMSVEETLSKLDKDVDQILEKRRWLLSKSDEF
jgi:multiple sugar transport system substrate-binding protein